IGEQKSQQCQLLIKLLRILHFRRFVSNRWTLELAAIVSNCKQLLRTVFTTTSFHPPQNGYEERKAYIILDIAAFFRKRSVGCAEEPHIDSNATLYRLITVHRILM
uniref:Uncharacterized protein n=1 Tax=Wuchereria bancrofti TaxID=6293 RepID=A0A1I8EQL5_WUCBA